ncbi:hypothetical protein [Algihabitans albus]|uniref:hypothetical protein n=1 Tax=Algihabitans albus TaxID=2164067 RepID=UPI000E5D2100|nr:hypothetical protein [Algihabitans albus]
MTKLTLLIPAALLILLTACSEPERQPSGLPAATAPAGETSPLLSVPPEALVWSQPGVADDRRQDDIESCYAFARARVQTNRQIDQDIRGNLSQSGSYNTTRGFQGRLDDFESRNRQSRLFNDCMESKGYVQGAPADAADPQPAQ